jgi:hypothetical protein
MVIFNANSSLGISGKERPNAAVGSRNAYLDRSGFEL